MILILSFLAGCQQDLLLLGDVTGLRDLSPTAPQLPVRADTAMAAGTPTPDVPPADVRVADAGTAEPKVTEPGVVPDGEPTGAAEPKFNPISVPEGAREGDGVRWEGVKVKGRPTSAPGSRRASDELR